MNLEQSYVYKKPYCLICGRETDEETCSPPCARTLQMVRNTISNQITIEEELGGVKPKWNAREINAFNKLQDYINDVSDKK